MESLQIAVLYNVPTVRSRTSAFAASDEDTASSARTVVDAVSRLSGVTAFAVAVDETTKGTIAGIRADAVVNLIEWTGLDLPLVGPAFSELRRSGIPYTGANARVYIGTTDKIRMKRLFAKCGVPTPAWRLIRPRGCVTADGIALPVIVKLAYEHCGIGLTPTAVVRKPEALAPAVTSRIREFRQPVIVEEYIDGAEYQVTVIDDGKTATVLPISEYVFDCGKQTAILTYDSRWNRTNQQDVRFRVRLARLPAAWQRRIDAICLAAYRDLGFWGYARFDIRVKPDGSVFILETNANPGIDDDIDNGLVRSFKAAGMDLTLFCAGILSSACVRFGRGRLAADIRARAATYTAAVRPVALSRRT